MSFESVRCFPIKLSLVTLYVKYVVVCAHQVGSYLSHDKYV